MKSQVEISPISPRNTPWFNPRPRARDTISQYHLERLEHPDPQAQSSPSLHTSLHENIYRHRHCEKLSYKLTKPTAKRYRINLRLLAESLPSSRPRLGNLGMLVRRKRMKREKLSWM
jgi:hypothetical protein